MNHGRSYSELAKLPTFEERYEYLKLQGKVGETKFGFSRFLNQSFYSSAQWRRVRNKVILRDEGCDLGVPGHEINSRIYIHHIIPVTIEMLMHNDPLLLSLDNLISVSDSTHRAIHLGDTNLIEKALQARTKNDTTPWK